MNLSLRLIEGSIYNPGDRKELSKEAYLPDITFESYKFNNRPKPDRSKVVIFPAFSEFGSETLIPLYCIPKLMQTKYQGYYSIVAGWYGRSYLYKHLVDEFWEIKEEFQHLREYCKAINHKSRNLHRLESAMKSEGHVVRYKEMERIVNCKRIERCTNKLKDGNLCGGWITQYQDYQYCPSCKAQYYPPGLYQNCEERKKSAVWIPMPSEEKIELTRALLPPNPIGITARARKCYGRNLTKNFYIRLINLVENMGYNPVWLGEKSTTIPCPVNRVLDFSRTEYARDLECTLALVSQLKFTIQFWTASTRLAGLVGTPYIIFESPDQIWMHGQEGYRLHLTTKGNKKKLVVAHFLNVLENNTKALNVIEDVIADVERDNYSTVIGMVSSEAKVREIIRNNRHRIGWF